MTRSGASASAAVSSSGVRAKASGVPTMRAVSLMRATKNRSLTTATALIVLLLDAEPVLVPLGEMSERREVAHAIEVDDAVEVVGLVLDDAREELLRLALDAASFPVIRVEPNGGEPRHHPAHVGHGETALPALFHLLGQRGQRRIDEDGQRDARGFRIARVLVDLDDADPLEDVHLRGGEARAVVLAHGLDHVVDEPLRVGRPYLADGHRQRLLPQYGVSQARDLQDGHVMDPLPWKCNTTALSFPDAPDVEDWRRPGRILRMRVFMSAARGTFPVGSRSGTPTAST